MDEFFKGKQINHEQLRQMLEVLAGIPEKRAKDGDKRPTNSNRIEFLAFIRQCWELLPGYQSYDRYCEYRCIDGNHDTVVKMMSRYLSVWLFFSNKSDDEFPIVPCPLVPASLLNSPLPHIDRPLNAYFPTETGEKYCGVILLDINFL